MNLMASSLLALLALVAVTIFVMNLNIANSSLLVPVTSPPTTPRPLSTTTTAMMTSRSTTLKPFNCKRMLLSMGKKVFKNFGICNRDMKTFIPSEKEREKRMQCSIKCVLKKIGISNPRDLVTMESFDVFLKGFLPESYHEVAHIIVDGCIEDFVDKGEAPLQEDFCESYGVFLNCVQDKFVGIC